MSLRSQADSYNLLGQSQTPRQLEASEYYRQKRKHFRVDPFHLLGQKEPFPIAVHLPGKAEPNLTIEWKSFHSNFFSGIPVFFSWTRTPKDASAIEVFRDCRIRRPAPYRAVVAAALWHVVFFIVPWPHLPAMAQHNSALDNTQLTWSGPINDLPLLNIPKPAHKSAAAKPAEPDPPAPAVDAYHPRQRIFTDPVHPTHPRQTLVNTAAPPDAPKVLTPLPNMVQFAASAGPERPRLQISEATLAKLKPKAVKRTATTDTPTPEMPNMETQPAAISLVQSANAPARPKLDINAGSVPRLAEQLQKGETVSAPDLANGAPAATGGPSSTIIALSANPAPPAPVVEVPKGNLSARVSISPEGKGSGSGGGSGNGGSGSAGGSDPSGGSGTGNNAIGISISGGSPQPKSGVSGLGGGSKLIIPKPQSGYSQPDAKVASEELSERIGPPNFAALPPGAPPEQVFSSHRVYALNVNMPNLNSATGSWVIRISELHLASGARKGDDVTTPVPVHKIDPKYPPDLLKEHVQGEVILYGVIREDGSVDSIQLVRGIDPQLNANSISAFGQWKFRPATKDGQPVAVEAIVHIPFREPARE